MKEHLLGVPADYGCLALIDPENYSGFVSEDWAIEGITKHFVSQNQIGVFVAWGCSDGNWIVKIVIGDCEEEGFRSFSSWLKSDGNVLLTSYESLTMAAQFEDVTLPEAQETRQMLKVEPGSYKVTVIQLFSTDNVESDEVVNKNTPHYIVALEKLDKPGVSIADIPWFQGY